MKKMIKMLWITLAIGIATPAVASNGDLGTVVGGIAGGLIGSNIGHGSGKTVATIGGAVIGGLVGNQVGSSVDYSERCRRAPCYRYSHWDAYQTPVTYRTTFIGRDGRLCRRSIFVNDFGDRISATYCCHRMSSHGYCKRWVRVA